MLVLNQIDDVQCLRHLIVYVEDESAVVPWLNTPFAFNTNTTTTIAAINPRKHIQKDQQIIAWRLRFRCCFSSQVSLCLSEPSSELLP